MRLEATASKHRAKWQNWMSWWFMLRNQTPSYPVRRYHSHNPASFSSFSILSLDPKYEPRSKTLSQTHCLTSPTPPPGMNTPRVSCVSVGCTTWKDQHCWYLTVFSSHRILLWVFWHHQSLSMYVSYPDIQIFRQEKKTLKSPNTSPRPPFSLLPLCQSCEAAGFEISVMGWESGSWVMRTDDDIARCCVSSGFLRCTRMYNRFSTWIFLSLIKIHAKSELTLCYFDFVLWSSGITLLLQWA